MAVELFITNRGNTIYYPPVEDDIQIVWERTGTAGKLTFKLIDDGTFEIQEGDVVSLLVDGTKLFRGFVFTVKRTQDADVSVTAYDQLRYFKNKETYTYTKTATELIKTIASDFNLQVGSLADTGYVIPSRVEDKKTLFDIVKTALDLTLENTKELFIFYDDFGSLTLKNLSDMKVNILIDADTAQSFDYQSSIDSDTYNQVKLVYDNKDTGVRDAYVVKDSSHINDWGLLQYLDEIKEGENGQTKAEGLLQLYNQKTKTLTISNVFGDTRVRAGSLVIVQLSLGDISLNNYMLVEKCTHTFKENEHYMTLKLRGGVINSA